MLTKQAMTLEQKKQLESHFIKLSAGSKVDWDVMVIKDWAAFYDLIEELVREEMSRLIKEIADYMDTRVEKKTDLPVVICVRCGKLSTTYTSESICHCGGHFL